MIGDTCVTQDLSLVPACEIATEVTAVIDWDFGLCMEVNAGKGQSQGLTQGVRRHIAVHESWPSPANIYTHSPLSGGELCMSAG